MVPIKNKKLVPLLLTYFVGVLGYGIVIPFMVVVVNRMGGNALVYGIVSALYPASQLIGSAVLGNWSDRFGRKPILLLSQFGTFIGWLVFLVALILPRTEIAGINSGLIGTFTLTVPLVLVAIARIIDGLTGGNYVVAQAYLADIVPPNERTASFGKMTMVGNLGNTVGPALAGLLGGTILAEKLPIMLSMALSVITMLTIIFFLPESGRHVKISDLEGTEPIPKKSRYSVIFANKNIVFLLSLYFAMFIGFNIFYTAFPVHAINTLGWSIGKMGAYIAVLSCAMMVVQGPVLSRVSKKVSSARLIMLGSLFLGINFLLISTSRTMPTYAAALFFALGNGLMWPSMLSLLSRLAGDKIQGLVQGFAGSLGSAASIVGLLLGGILYDQIGSVSFMISAVIFGLVVLASVRIAGLESEAKPKKESGKP